MTFLGILKISFLILLALLGPRSKFDIFFKKYSKSADIQKLVLYFFELFAREAFFDGSSVQFLF